MAMNSKIYSISSDYNNVRQDIFPFGPWTVTTRKGIILQSKCTCQRNEEKISDTDSSGICDLCQYYRSLPQLHSLPDMLFSKNLLRLEHYTGLGIEFNPLEALKLVEETRDPLQVAIAGGWQSARADFPFARSVVKPYDWTFTTRYRGTLLSDNKTVRQKTTTFNPTSSNPNLQNYNSTVLDTTTSDRDTEQEQDVSPQLEVEETTERIDVNKLKVRDEILFYDNVTLYEDELADHGAAEYSVKIRIMPKCLFILARFHLRIDGVLARINDTRIFGELNKKYLLREYTNREAKLTSLDLPVSTLVNPNELMHHLPIVHSSYEKLSLPKRDTMVKR